MKTTPETIARLDAAVMNMAPVSISVFMCKGILSDLRDMARMRDALEGITLTLKFGSQNQTGLSERSCFSLHKAVSEALREIGEGE